MSMVLGGYNGDNSDDEPMTAEEKRIAELEAQLSIRSKHVTELERELAHWREATKAPRRAPTGGQAIMERGTKALFWIAGVSYSLIAIVVVLRIAGLI